MPQWRHHGRWLVLLTILLAWFPAAAAPLPLPLADGGVATVAGVIDGDTVRLDDGRQVRLVGIQAPKLPLGRPEFEPWPLADAAKAALAGLIDGRKYSSAMAVCGWTATGAHSPTCSAPMGCGSRPRCCGAAWRGSILSRTTVR